MYNELGFGSTVFLSFSSPGASKCTLCNFSCKYLLIKQIDATIPPGGPPCDLSSPIAAVQSAVLNGLGQVSHGQMLGALQIRDGPRNFEDAVVGAGGQALLLHGPLQQALGIGAQFAVGANLARSHLRVSENLFAGLFEALPLPFASGHHPVANLSRSFGRRAAAQFLVLHRWNLDMYIDAVEKRAGDFGDIALNDRRSAMALARLVIEIAAGAGVHGRRQHETGRKAERHGGARDGYRV